MGPVWPLSFFWYYVPQFLCNQHVRSLKSRKTPNRLTDQNQTLQVDQVISSYSWSRLVWHWKPFNTFRAQMRKDTHTTGTSDTSSSDGSTFTWCTASFTELEWYQDASSAWTWNNTYTPGASEVSSSAIVTFALHVVTFLLLEWNENRAGQHIMHNIQQGGHGNIIITRGIKGQTLSFIGSFGVNDGRSKSWTS